jgi:hypothetical protein
VAISYSTAPKDKEVGASVEFFSPRLLGRHVSHGSDGRTGTRQVVRIDGYSCEGGSNRTGDGSHFGQSKVEDLGLSPLGNEEVRRLEIAVDNARAMCNVQGIRNLHTEVYDLLGGHGMALDAVLQGGAFEVLHDDVVAVVIIADVIDGADVRMIEC